MAAEPHAINIRLTTLQNPVSSAFDTITDALRPVDRGQKAYGKLLDKTLPSQPLPTDHDAMAEHVPLINRAVAMHFLREGEFEVAKTFLNESRPNTNLASLWHTCDEEKDLEMTPRDEEDENNGVEADGHTPPIGSTQLEKMAKFHNLALLDKFARMYEILSYMRKRKLVPAIEWAAQNSYELESRGSTLEFELNKLQFIYLFQQGGADPEDTTMMTEEERMMNGCACALDWARDRFVRFQSRHSREIQQLVTAVIYASNLPQSPYRTMFTSSGIKSAFDEACTSFMHDFCSLLGLSSESPLYIAVTAGAIALPQLLKYTSRVKEKRTEWTTEAELAFETPLPASMVYHPIFVCPVSKEQTTESNPPIMLPCGHVLAEASFQPLVKGSKVKCPYCPVEGHKTEARMITIL